MTSIRFQYSHTQVWTYSAFLSLSPKKLPKIIEISRSRNRLVEYGLGRSHIFFRQNLRSVLLVQCDVVQRGIIGLGAQHEKKLTHYYNTTQLKMML